MKVLYVDIRSNNYCWGTFAFLTTICSYLNSFLSKCFYVAHNLKLLPGRTNDLKLGAGRLRSQGSWEDNSLFDLKNLHRQVVEVFPSQGWKGQGATLLGAPLKLTNVSKLRCQSGVRNTTCLFQYSAVSSWASKVDRNHPQKLGKRRRKRMSCLKTTATIWRMPFKPSVANATRRCTSARWRITLKADINLSSPSTTGSTKIQALNLSRSPITSVSFAGKNWF